MRASLSLCAILLCFCLPAVSWTAPSMPIRTFAAPPSQPQADGYAEITFESAKRGPDRDSIEDHARVWFNGSDKYRVEYGRPARGVELHLGRHVYTSSIIRGNERWWGMPESWMPGDMPLLRGGGIKMQNARLIATETMQGLRVQHWRGRSLRNASLDVWKSTDPRLPIVLAWDRTSRESHGTWRVSKLELKPIPAYVFSTQLHPKPGLRALLRQPFRPFSVVLLLHVLSLVCYVALVCKLPSSKSRGSLGICVISGLLLLSTLFVCRQPTDYWNQSSDTPALALLALLTLGAMAMMVRFAGVPGEARLCRGITWPVVLCAVAVGALGFLSQYRSQSAMAQSLGLHHWALPFLPITLLNVAIDIFPSAALQEIVFRGYIYHALEQRLRRPIVVIAIQALLFAVYHIPRDLVVAIHGHGHCPIVAMVWSLLWGVLFGIIRCRTRSIAAPTLVHAAFNLGVFYVSSASMLALFQALAL